MFSIKPAYPKSMPSLFERLAKNIVSQIGIPVILSGCAVSHFDQETGTYHLYGLGHMKMKVEADKNVEKSACIVITGMESLGVVLLQEPGSYSVALGWEKKDQMRILAQDTSVNIESPKFFIDLFNLKVNSVSKDFPDGLFFCRRTSNEIN